MYSSFLNHIYQNIQWTRSPTTMRPYFPVKNDLYITIQHAADHQSHGTSSHIRYISLHKHSRVHKLSNTVKYFRQNCKKWSNHVSLAIVDTHCNDNELLRTIKCPNKYDVNVHFYHFASSLLHRSCRISKCVFCCASILCQINWLEMIILSHPQYSWLSLTWFSQFNALQNNSPTDCNWINKTRIDSIGWIPFINTWVVTNYWT